MIKYLFLSSSLCVSDIFQWVCWSECLRKSTTDLRTTWAETTWSHWWPVKTLGTGSGLGEQETQIYKENIQQAALSLKRLFNAFNDYNRLPSPFSSEMLLGPVPNSFNFLPKHKANSYKWFSLCLTIKTSMFFCFFENHFVLNNKRLSNCLFLWPVMQWVHGCLYTFNICNKVSGHTKIFKMFLKYFSTDYKKYWDL